MSKERARRREAREAASAVAHERAERRRLAEVARSRARAGRGRARRQALGLRTGPSSPRLRRAASRRWAPVLALALAAHGVVWVLTDDWGLRAAAVGVTVLAAPVVYVLVTDSAVRSGRSRRTGRARRPGRARR